MDCDVCAERQALVSQVMQTGTASRTHPPVGAARSGKSLFQTPDQARQHHTLTQVARLVDAGILTTTAHRDLGKIDAAGLREGHRILESGTAVGEDTLTGF